MRYLSFAARHLLTLIVIVLLAVVVSVYSNPHSLHRVIVTDYDGFDTSPDASGIVRIGAETIGFRLPDRPLDSSIVEQEPLVDTEMPTSAAAVERCVGQVRTHLDGLDDSKPTAAGVDARQLLRSGQDYYALCSDYALLLNELLQSSGQISRVLWLESHVAAEYFDFEQDDWVYVDPQLNTRFTGSDGQPLSAAALIRAMENDVDVKFEPVVDEADQPLALSHESIDRRWYRNVLLNGECTALSGDTLEYPSRWTQLLRCRSLPCSLVLQTVYDTSAGAEATPLRLRTIIVVSLLLAVTVYGVVIPLSRRPARIDREAVASSKE